jgi:hypothetical protein
MISRATSLVQSYLLNSSDCVVQAGVLVACTQDLLDCGQVTVVVVVVFLAIAAELTAFFDLSGSICDLPRISRTARSSV